MPHERSTLYRPRSAADRVADLVTSFAGRWAWVLAHVLLYGAWLLTSLCGLDPRPHGLLTMTVALESVFLVSFILIGQRRRAAIERERDVLEGEEAHELAAMHAEQVELIQRLGEDLALLRNEHRALHEHLRRVLERGREP